MELQSAGFNHRTKASRMIKKVLGLAALLAACVALTGCTAIQNYSLRSYQGPLPIEDYRYVNPETYGVPTVSR